MDLNPTVVGIVIAFAASLGLLVRRSRRYRH